MFAIGSVQTFEFRLLFIVMLECGTLHFRGEENAQVDF